MPIINSRADLDALRGTDAYAEALRIILGATTMWVNTAPADQSPAWEQRSVGDTLAKLDLTTQELLAECAAAGIVPQSPAAPVSIAPEPPALAVYAANRRYQYEVSGVAWGDYVAQTDRESQAKMIAEFVAINAGLRADPSPWKFADNKFALNADMAAVCLAGRDHVAAAFAIERAVQEAIVAGTVTTLAEIDAAFA